MYVCMYGVVREVNDVVLGKGLELLWENGGMFEMNQLLFADDTALLVTSEEKLFRLVSEFERQKLRVNVGKRKVVRCSRYVMWVEFMRLNGEPIEEVDCLKYQGSPSEADRECERDMVQRMNEGYIEW